MDRYNPDGKVFRKRGDMFPKKKRGKVNNEKKNTAVGNADGGKLYLQ